MTPEGAIKRAGIIELVKARIDELSPFNDTSLVPSVNVIDKILDNSAKTILLALPLHLLTPTVFTGTITQTGNTGHVTLDNDFLRLHSFKMTEWDTEVTQAITPANPKYILQKNPITMGGVNKPVVVIKSDSNGKTLYYYSIPTGGTHTLEYAYYIPLMTAENLPDDILDVVAWQCAADVILIMKGDPKGALLKVEEYIKLQTI